jgi:hypothetical protein
MKRIAMSQAERDRPAYSNRARDKKVTDEIKSVLNDHASQADL